MSKEHYCYKIPTLLMKSSAFRVSTSVENMGGSSSKFEEGGGLSQYMGEHGGGLKTEFLKSR